MNADDLRRAFEEKKRKKDSAALEEAKRNEQVRLAAAELAVRRQQNGWRANFPLSHKLRFVSMDRVLEIMEDADLRILHFAVASIADYPKGEKMRKEDFWACYEASDVFIDFVNQELTASGLADMAKEAGMLIRPLVPLINVKQRVLGKTHYVYEDRHLAAVQVCLPEESEIAEKSLSVHDENYFFYLYEVYATANKPLPKKIDYARNLDLGSC